MGTPFLTAVQQPNVQQLLPELARSIEFLDGHVRLDLIANSEVFDANVESPEGLSPPGAPRTVHDPLESHGSRCPAVAMT